MEIKHPRCELFLSRDGWRWRLKAGNGQIGATSEAYGTFKEARAWGAAWTNKLTMSVPTCYPPDLAYAQAERQNGHGLKPSVWRRILKRLKFGD